MLSNPVLIRKQMLYTPPVKKNTIAMLSNQFVNRIQMLYTLPVEKNTNAMLSNWILHRIQTDKIQVKYYQTKWFLI